MRSRSRYDTPRLKETLSLDVADTLQLSSTENGTDLCLAKQHPQKTLTLQQCLSFQPMMKPPRLRSARIIGPIRDFTMHQPAL